MAANEPTKDLSSQGLADQLFDAAFAQYRSDPREAARQVIRFLTEALVYACKATASDDAARRALLTSVGETIIAAPLEKP